MCEKKDFVSTHSNEQLAGFINQFESQKGQLSCIALMLSRFVSHRELWWCAKEEGGWEKEASGVEYAQRQSSRVLKGAAFSSLSLSLVSLNSRVSE